MSAIGPKIVDAGRQYIGARFRDHFDPTDPCNRGTVTSDICMERGLGEDGGFDCSGLVIASICTALNMQPRQWPQEYRHARQLSILQEDSYESKKGDVALFYLDGLRSIHLGILAANLTVIHASERTGYVEEGTVRGDISKIRVIPQDKLLELIQKLS